MKNQVTIKKSVNRKAYLFHCLPIMAMALFFTSCHVAYIPSMQNVPLLTKAGEVDLTLSPTNFQAAVSPVDHIGVMVNGQVSHASWDNNDYDAKRKMIEAGLGYYNKTVDNRIVEIYAGGGGGSIHFEDNFNADRILDASLTRLFVQPSIGFGNEYIEAAVSTRLLKLDFFDLRTKNYTPEELDADNLKNIDLQSYYFFEPAITFRAGYKNIRAHFQYMYSYKINNAPLNAYFQVFNVGVNIRF